MDRKFQQQIIVDQIGNTVSFLPRSDYYSVYVYIVYVYILELRKPQWFSS